MGKKAARKPVLHRPATDAEAKAIIERLDHDVWETHKVSGRFVENPYLLEATVQGRQHFIALPGRKGSVLPWLLARRDAREAVAA